MSKFTDNFKKASTGKKVFMGVGIAAGAFLVPHAALVAGAGGLIYAGKAIYDKGNKPQQ